MPHPHPRPHDEVEAAPAGLAGAQTRDVRYAKAGTNMVLVYPVVKTRSTTYCGLNLGHAQDVGYRRPMPKSIPVSELPAAQLPGDIFGLLGELLCEDEVGQLECRFGTL